MTTKRKVRVAIVVALVGVAAAAAYLTSANVRFTYEEITHPDETGNVKFVLPRSLIMLQVKRSIEEGQRLVAATVPSDASADGSQRLYAIVPHDSIGVTTRLNVTYIPDTRIMSSLGVRIEDNRLRTVSAAAGAIVAATGVSFKSRLGPDSTPERLPVVIDPSVYERERSSHRWVALPNNAGWSYRLDVDAPPVDAVKRSEFFRADRGETNLIPVPACRTATLYVLAGDSPQTDEGRDQRIGEAWTFGLRIGDPEYLWTLTLPPEGMIDMHTGCGADVKAGKTDATSTWELVGESMKQAGALRNAYDQLSMGKKK